MPIRIGHWVRGWRLDKFFKKMFNEISEEAKVLIPVVIGIVEKFKQLVDSPVADIITELIPGEWDDDKKDKLRRWLPHFILGLDLWGVTANIEDTNERLIAVLAQFKFVNDKEKDDFYHVMGYRIIEFMADDNLTRSEVITLGQLYYEFKHKAAA